MMRSVRFKQDQKIRNLDKHAQSGGEKSVSTMLYLVALQVGDMTVRCIVRPVHFDFLAALRSA
eukprot:SAG31_NODE_206_length_20335_cov_17.910160_15_plen_63_part_00